MQIRIARSLFLMILLQQYYLHHVSVSAAWPLSNYSNIQLLQLVSNLINVSDSDTVSIHSQAMFKAAILLSAQHNITIQGQFVTGLIQDTTGTEIGAIAAACKVVSTSNIVGIVGPTYSRQSPIIASLGMRIGIPVISYAATDPALSDKSTFPAFYRTAPSDNAAALAIAQLFLGYNWTSCIIIYQDDAFGNGGAKAITNTFLKNGLEVVNTLPFEIATLRTQDNLKDALTSSSTRIVVLWMISAYSTIVLQDALKSDVLGPNYLWILSQSIDLTDFNEALYPKLIGMLTIEPTVASITNAPINKTLLNAAYNLWKQYEPETFPGPDNVDYYALFGFDATWLLIQSLQQLCSTINNSSFSCISPNNASFCFERQIFNSDAFFNIINKMTFLGVSGHIQFNVNTTDRINGSYYVAKNVQYSSNTLNFVRVLSYSDHNGWQRASETQVVWPGNSLVLPTGNARLEGTKLRIAIIESIPFTIVQNITNALGQTTVSVVGYASDLIVLLQNELKFIPDIRLTPDNRTYNELIDDVAKGIYDIIVADVTVTSARREKVDFSASIFDNSLRLMIRKTPDTGIDYFSFLRPLSTGLWLLIIGTVIFSTMLICLLEREENPNLKQKSLFSICALSLWYCCCTIMERHEALHIQTGPGRLLETALLFLSLVIVASYTANLASELTISKSKSIISGLDDLKRSMIPPKRIGVREGTASVDFYLREISGGSANFYPLRGREDMYNCLLNNTIDVAIQDGGVAEYVTNNVYCNLTIVGEEFDKGSLAIVTPKRWLYAQDLDVALLSIRESGRLEDLRNKWFAVKQCPDQPTISTAIEVRSLVGLFITFGIVCIVALLLFSWKKLSIAQHLSSCMNHMKRPFDRSVRTYNHRKNTNG